MDTGFHVVQTELLDIAYEDRGPRDGLPVILLHGWPDDVLTWDGVVAPLNAAGFRTIAPYLRGFGPTRFRTESSIRSGQLAALGSDVIDLARVLRLDPFALIGHDWGARAAYIAATEIGPQVSHLVALSVGYGTNDPGQQLALVQVRNYWYHWYFALTRGSTSSRTPGTSWAGPMRRGTRATTRSSAGCRMCRPFACRPWCFTATWTPAITQ